MRCYFVPVTDALAAITPSEIPQEAVNMTVADLILSESYVRT